MTTRLKRKTNRKRFVDVFALKAHDRAAGRAFRREKKKKSRTKLFPFLPCCDFQDASSHSLLLPRGQHPPNFIPLCDPRGAVSGWAGLTPEKGFAPHLQLSSETLWGGFGGFYASPIGHLLLTLPTLPLFPTQPTLTIPTGKRALCSGWETGDSSTSAMSGFSWLPTTALGWNNTALAGMEPRAPGCSITSNNGTTDSTLTPTKCCSFRPPYVVRAAGLGENSRDAAVLGRTRRSLVGSGREEALGFVQRHHKFER